MNDLPAYPSLYQINTRVWLNALGRSLGKPATLDDIPNAELDRLAGQGFDWIWLLSVWQTGLVAQRISRTQPQWREDFELTLTDLDERDIAGSGFAITEYSVHAGLGGDAALARLRERLRERGMRLLLDFVPNHMAPDHPWVEQHPEYFIHGSETTLAHEPQNYCRLQTSRGPVVLAHGRDPHFSGWPDTVQLDYANAALQEAMTGELMRIATQCDGVRCDMAMLGLPEVFERTWSLRPAPFWPQAIRRVHDQEPGFTFMAEVYWDLEWTLLQQGFDYAYDKRLYDRLEYGDAASVAAHLHAGLDYQGHLVRFLENHDEPRAAAAFAASVHEAAAVVTYLSPGMRFFHQGQFEGRKKRISPHLVRGPDEPSDPQLVSFYGRLLALLQRTALRSGAWQQLPCVQAWDGNFSSQAFLACLWQGDGAKRLLVAVNYAAHPSQCYVRLPLPDLDGRAVRLGDLMGPASYERQGCDLVSGGLYLDLPPWGYHVFEISMA